MAARVIDGKKIAADVRLHVAEQVATLRAKGGGGSSARLDAVLVAAGPDDPSLVYAENQAKTCAELGIEYRLHRLPAAPDYDAVAERVVALNTDPLVHAIMVHLPLPPGIDRFDVQSLIAPEKDVEGVNPVNIGNIVYGRSSLAPCTALAVVRMIESTGISLRGQRAIVVGASDHVGKPIAAMLMRLEATVISCNKHTKGIEELARTCDILVAAAGVPGLVRGAWLKPGAIVIDVGIHRVDAGGGDGKKHTVGDVVQDEAATVAGWLSPVPGGVGPVTVAMLLENVVAAATRR